MISELVQVTFFSNHVASAKREEAICLTDLADRIFNARAASKRDLPWLKLATFGDHRTDKNSLRHDSNVLTITGVEGDYDGELVSFGQAVAILAKAGVEAIVYTSPSHTAAAPRWRVLCQFSRAMPPGHRNLHMARLNGLFNGIIARESWILSQSYYFGSVVGNPDHRVEVIPGTPIDLLSELDVTAIAKPGNGRANERPANSGTVDVQVSSLRFEKFGVAVLDRLRRAAVDGQKHAALRSAAITLGGIQAAAEITDAHAIPWLLRALPASVLDWDAARQTAAWGLAKGREKPIELTDRPYLSNGGHAPPEPPAAASKTDDSTGPKAEINQGSSGCTPIEPTLRTMDAATLLKTEFPRRELLLAPWLPEKGLAMVYGPRGIGKTHLSLGIAYAVATGGQFLHWKAPQPRRVLLIDGEMPTVVLQERLAAIVAAADLAPAPDFLRFLSMDNQDGGDLDLSDEAWHPALEAAIDGADLLIVDNISTLARCGRENEAESWLPVQQWALRQRRADRSVVFIHHAGKSGQQRGTSRREDVLDTVVALRRPSDYQPDEGARFEVHYEKSRGFHGDDAKPFEAALIHDKGWTTRDLADVETARVMELTGQNLSVREIAVELAMSKSTVNRLQTKGRAAATKSNAG